MTSNKFLENALYRLEMGAAEYGDESFYRKDADLLKEVSEELFDVATWSSIWACKYSSSSPTHLKLKKIAKGAKSLHEDLNKAWAEMAVGENIPAVNPSPGVSSASAWLEKCLE